MNNEEKHQINISSQDDELQSNEEAQKDAQINTPQNEVSVSSKPSNNNSKSKKYLKPIIIATALIVAFAILTSTHIICINHDWEAATCIEPAQCIYCEKYKDDVIGNHKWLDGNCTTPRTCFWCDLEEGEPIGHQSEWVTIRQATTLNSGKEELHCYVCNKVLDTRDTSKKSLNPNDKSFGFEDEEFLDWFNDVCTAQVEYTDLDLFEGTSTNTSYRVTTVDGNIGIIMLNHDDNDKVAAIMIWFDEYEYSLALTAFIGEEINSVFSADRAIDKLVDDEFYTAAEMTTTRINMDEGFEVTILAPSAFFEKKSS